MALSIFAALLALSAPAELASEPLNLAACRPDFEDRFHTLDVSRAGPGTRWIAHTPWFGDFGDAQFTDPGPGSAFSTGPDGLTITAAKGPSGRWTSGLLSSTDPRAQGFSAARGYFEMTSTFPPGPGLWPAFWLVTADHSLPLTVEVDAIEYYGLDPKHYFVTVTVRPKDPKLWRSVHVRLDVPDESLVTGPHAYGVAVGNKDVVFYRDRQEVFRTPTPPELVKPLGILLNLALGSGFPITETPNPSRMVVSRVVHYSDLERCGVPAGAAGD